MACHMEYYYQISNNVVHTNPFGVVCKFGIIKFMSILLCSYVDLRMYVHTTNVCIYVCDEWNQFDCPLRSKLCSLCIRMYVLSNDYAHVCIRIRTYVMCVCYCCY